MIAAFLLFLPSISLQCLVVKLSATDIRAAVKAALAEDIGPGDATTLATVLPSLKASALSARARAARGRRN